MRNKNLKDVLIAASEKVFNSREIEVFYSDLQNIYENQQYRHKYSDISKIVLEIIKKTKDTSKVETLCYNLEQVIDKVKLESPNSILYKQLFKLLDHVSLDLFRYDNYDITALDKTINQLEIANQQLAKTYEDVQFRKNIDLIKDEVEEFNKQSGSTRNTIEKFNLQLISVLGIFSAIIIAFFGGLSFFTSVFNNITAVGNCKLIFVTLIVGFTIFNLIAFLLASISYLIDKPLPMSGAKTFYKTIFLVFNGVCLISALIDLYIWFK